MIASSARAFSRVHGRSELLAIAVLSGVLSGCGAPPDNLLIVTLDTVRRDHLPSYGYARDTAPALSALAREGVVFDQALSQSSNTNPSHASMFTGLNPRSHGATANGVPLPSKITTLAQVLSGQGFETAAVVAGSPLRARASGLGRGFDVYDEGFHGSRRRGSDVVRRARRWLDARGEERWFLFVHFYDAHGPYRPTGAYARLFTPAPPLQPLERIPAYQRRGATRVESDLEDFVARYDAEIRYVDDRVAELLATVDLDRTLVAVLADHGETLGERYHKLDHGAQVFDEQMRIPLVMRGPGLAPRRFAAPVATVDLMPTLLDLLDVAPPHGLVFEGRSLAKWLRDGGEPGERPVFGSARAVSERHADREYDLDPNRRIEAVRSEGWKLIRYPGVENDYLELYDLTRDPGEHHDRSREAEDRLEGHGALLDDRPNAVATPAVEHELPDELRGELRALGYGD